MHFLRENLRASAFRFEFKSKPGCGGPAEHPLSRCAWSAAADRITGMSDPKTTRPNTPAAGISSLIVAFLIGGLVAGFLMKSRDAHEPPPLQTGDAELVRSLLAENLTDRTFDFATVAEACSGKRVIPLGDGPAHQRVVAAIERALAETIHELNNEDSPVRKLRRINEASRFFEDGLQARLDAMPGLHCATPPTRAGVPQRAGYPDLRIVDEASGTVFYLDPKLVERGSESGTLRTFYFEPKNETLKITDDAVHLIAGIEHDGQSGAWTFSGWRLVDLTSLQVRLKAEFQASNAALYRNHELSIPAVGP